MSIEFLLTSLIVVAIPGTGAIYTVSTAIGGGYRSGLFAAIGCTLGIVPHIVAAMLGLSGIMQIGAGVFEVVRWAGVACLVLMGISMIRDRGSLHLAGLTAAPSGPGLLVRRGVLLNLLNPKLTIFFFAFLPQFLDSSPTLLDPRLVGLAGIFMLMSLVVFAIYAWASAAPSQRLFAAPAAQRWLQRTFGTILLGVAARLAVTDR